MTIAPEGKIRILPPKVGACPLCGELHDRGEPHNKASLLYQHKFRLKHGRYPTWEDAMRHCSRTVKKRFCDRLKRHGIVVKMEEEKEDGKGRLE